jgi:hypothetical protein
MCNGDGLHDALGALQRAGFVRVRTITWDRRFPGLGGGLRHQVEFILVGLLPGSRSLSGVDLVSVSAVGPGDVVLDPFVGSGALLVGARERGAHVIGCDIAPAALRTAKVKLGSTGTTAKPGRRPSQRASVGRRRPGPKGQPRAGR